MLQRDVLWLKRVDETPKTRRGVQRAVSKKEVVKEQVLEYNTET